MLDQLTIGQLAWKWNSTKQQQKFRFIKSILEYSKRWQFLTLFIMAIHDWSKSLNPDRRLNAEISKIRERYV